MKQQEKPLLGEGHYEEFKETYPRVTQVKKTPFTLIENEKNTLICLGDTAIMECKDKAEADAKIRRRDWDLITITAMCSVDKLNKLKQHETERTN